MVALLFGDDFVAGVDIIGLGIDLAVHLVTFLVACE
jgi:hypothetical protein